MTSIIGDTELWPWVWPLPWL